MPSQIPDQKLSLNLIVNAAIIARAKLGERRLARELGCDGQLSDLEHNTKLIARLPETGVALTDGSTRDLLYKQIARWQDSGISSVVLGQPGYPQALSSIADPPWILWYQGMIPDHLTDASLSELRAIAIVGSRDCDRYGYDFAHSCARDLASDGITVISGLAIGIDTAAHYGALESQGTSPTLAVLGGGLNRLYPAVNSNLAGQILGRGGAIISQFEPDSPSFPSQFLDRNRVIAGLTSATVVVQASYRSGALATARYACESGREVMAVPGPVNSKRHAGTHKLIRDGAHLVTNADDIIELMPIYKRQDSDSKDRSGEQATELSPLQCQVLFVLKSEGTLQMEQLQNHFHEDSLVEEVLALELSGLVRRVPGNYLEAVEV